jgi:hypothetical protein
MMYCAPLMVHLKKSMKTENVFFSTYSVEEKLHLKHFSTELKFVVSCILSPFLTFWTNFARAKHFDWPEFLEDSRF